MCPKVPQVAELTKQEEQGDVSQRERERERETIGRAQSVSRLWVTTCHQLVASVSCESEVSSNRGHTGQGDIQGSGGVTQNKQLKAGFFEQ